MASEIETKVQQKEQALKNSQAKIDAAKHAIAGRQMILDRLVEDHERKAEDLTRMKELAKAHAPLQKRYDFLVDRINEMIRTHNHEDGMLQQDPEYIALKKEREELEPKLADTLPLIKKIYYGKDRA
jgi:multidrug resistance efflux pump